MEKALGGYRKQERTGKGMQKRGKELPGFPLGASLLSVGSPQGWSSQFLQNPWVSDWPAPHSLRLGALRAGYRAPTPSPVLPGSEECQSVLGGCFFISCCCFQALPPHPQPPYGCPHPGECFILALLMAHIICYAVFISISMHVSFYLLSLCSFEVSDPFKHFLIPYCLV